MKDSQNDNDKDENLNDNVVINGFANCIAQVHKIQTDEIMDNANLLDEQKNLVKNYKGKKNNRHILKNSVEISSDDENRSSSETDYNAYSSQEEELIKKCNITKEKIKQNEIENSNKDHNTDRKCVQFADMKNYKSDDFP